MRIILVIALILAIVAVSSAQKRRFSRRCKFCNRMKSFAERNPHRRLFIHLIKRMWFCKGCDPIEVEDKCTPDPCKNDGECQSENGSCICPPEFSGPTCEDPVPCLSNDEPERSCTSNCFGTEVNLFCDGNEVCCDLKGL
ncbi:hypothetical protein LOTGIDRAFT_160118 [Lottia gigantea]|uniref:EGF-like domain-containing protein n=1 Tax=Lottia gigantea TaxID=225164 RepID=V4AR14_LOTGI|nr:hypothetical protein LOTGIDRAFT_160118 [Lottia gigantea]ESO96131.1 hypothetical protein LOTGIDRAFT_160118 [Lottia gigantea]